MKKRKFRTADEATRAYEERFGCIPWGLSTMGKEDVIAAVEKALDIGEPYKCKIPKGCVL